MMTRRFNVAFLLMTQLALPPSFNLSLADDKGESRRSTRQSEPTAQQDQVLDAVKRGEIRPFPEIQAAAENDHVGAGRRRRDRTSERPACLRI